MLVKILAIIGVGIFLTIYLAFVLFMILFEIACIGLDLGWDKRWYDKEGKERGANNR